MQAPGGDRENTFARMVGEYRAHVRDAHGNLESLNWFARRQLLIVAEERLATRMENVFSQLTSFRGAEQPVEVVSFRTLDDADRHLSREGHRVSFLLLENKSSDEKWQEKLSQLFPWIETFELQSEHEKPRGELNFFHPEEGDEALLDRAHTLLERQLEFPRVRPQPPFSEGHTHFLTDDLGVLLSISYAEPFTSLVGDALMLPKAPKGSLGALAQRYLENLAATKETESFVGRVREAVAEEAGENPQVVEVPLEVHRVQTDPIPSAFLFFCDREDNGQTDVEITARMIVEGIRHASEHSFIHTLVVPLIGSLSERLPPDSLLRSILAELRQDASLNELRHIIFTVGSADHLIRLLQLKKGLGKRPHAQEIKNDSPTGEDQLGIEQEVNAITDAIALNKTAPPLVVGVLGGWGSGKSFVLHLMLKRLAALRKTKVTSENKDQFAFVGHPYWIHFDAWTYAKSNLWASLMQTIFAELNRGLEVEKLLRKADLPDNGELWESVAGLSSRGFRALNNEMGADVLQKFAQAQLNLENGHLGTHALLDAMAAAHEDEKNALAKRREERSEVVSQYERERERSKKNLVDELKALESKKTADLEDVETKKTSVLSAASESYDKKLSELHATHKNDKLEQQAPTEGEKALQQQRDELEKKRRQLAVQETQLQRRVDAEINRAALEKLSDLVLQSGVVSNFMDQEAVQAIQDALEEAKKTGSRVEDARRDVGQIVRSLSGWEKWIRGFSSPLALLALVLGFGLVALALFFREQLEFLYLNGAAAFAFVWHRHEAFQATAKKATKVIAEIATQAKQFELPDREERLQEIKTESSEEDSSYNDRESSLEELEKQLDEQKAQLAARRSEQAAALEARHNTSLSEARTLYLASTKRAEDQAIASKENIKAKHGTRVSERQASHREDEERAKQQHDKTLVELDAVITEQKKRIGMTALADDLPSLLTSRLDDYSEHLGLMHRIHSDLTDLSESLSVEAKRPHTEIFKRGAPRIFLVIDDLDRCPPPKVVEMLEAIQLLVKTKLFVVILAIDVRYVTRALEQVYDGVLARGGRPSGLDYIEKIVQVPYRVPKVPSDRFENLLKGQMDLELDPASIPPSRPSEFALKEQQSSSGDSETDATSRASERALWSSLGAAPEDTHLPDSAHQFENDELTMLTEACKLCNVGPRAVKRLVNVFKVMKIIWYRSGTPSREAREAALFLLALSARCPDAMRNSLIALENPMLDALQMNLPLNKFLEQHCKPRDLHPEELNQFKASLSAWASNEKRLSGAEMGPHLIRQVASFSFVGEIGREQLRFSEDGGN